MGLRICFGCSTAARYEVICLSSPVLIRFKVDTSVEHHVLVAAVFKVEQQKKYSNSRAASCEAFTSCTLSVRGMD